MPRLPKRVARFGLVLFLAGAAAVAATCSQSDTIIFVDVQATQPLSGVVRLHANLKVGGQTSDLDVPAVPTTEIAFPTSFTVQVGRSISGRLDVTLDAYDAASTLVSTGTASLTALTVGGQNMVTIDLAPGALPDGGVDDGGNPDVPGTGGSDGGVDATASGGAGGAAMGGAAGGSPGGAGGRAGAGGDAANGGRGGVGAGGGGHGGVSGAGGSASTGGVTATGGVTGTGGVTATGGLTGNGGASGRGGMHAGGAGGPASGGMDNGATAGSAGAVGDTGGVGGDGGAGGMGDGA